MGLQWAENTIEIAASPEQVFDAITDYETFPEWQSAVLGTEVTERQKKTGLGEVVKYDVDGKIRTIHYTLKYRYERPAKIEWDFLEGQGINQMDGDWTIVPSGDGAKATYRVGVDVSGVPGPILKRTQKSTVKKANEDLKAEAERRAAATGDDPARTAGRGDWEPAGASVPRPVGGGGSSGGGGDSVTDAAMEVVGAVTKLAEVTVSRALGIAGRVLGR
jgi:ribosome-associated toxin RatA of RatAB toxin-antitoxin module